MPTVHNVSFRMLRCSATSFPLSVREYMVETGYVGSVSLQIKACPCSSLSIRLKDLSPTTYFCFLMSEYLPFSTEARNKITSTVPFLNNILSCDACESARSLSNKIFHLSEKMGGSQQKQKLTEKHVNSIKDSKHP